MTVIENNRVVLPCPARGTPPPKVTWYHGDVRLTGNELGVTLLASGGLQIDNTQGENTGNYLCRAENVAGKAQHAISLLVYCECLRAKAAVHVATVPGSHGNSDEDGPQTS